MKWGEESHIATKSPNFSVFEHNCFAEFCIIQIIMVIWLDIWYLKIDFQVLRKLFLWIDFIKPFKLKGGVVV